MGRDGLTIMAFISTSYFRECADGTMDGA